MSFRKAKYQSLTSNCVKVGLVWKNLVSYC